MKRKIICLSVIGMLLLVGCASFSTVAMKTYEAKETNQTDEQEEPAPGGSITILGGRGLRIIARGLDPRIGDYVKIEYNYNRKGHDVNTYSVVGNYIRITNFQLDRGTYSVTAKIGGVTETKSGFFFICFFL